METLLHNGFSCGSDPHPLGGFGPAVFAENFSNSFTSILLVGGGVHQASPVVCAFLYCQLFQAVSSASTSAFALALRQGMLLIPPASTHPGCSAPPWRFAANAPLLCYRKETHCVDTLASDPCFKVQMVAVRVSCCTHILSQQEHVLASLTGTADRSVCRRRNRRPAYPACQSWPKHEAGTPFPPARYAW